MIGRIRVLGCGLIVSAVSLAACGGGSSGGSDSVDFFGTVRTSDDSTSRVERSLSDVEVCALGDCSITDAAGTWMLSSSASAFTGGDVLFSLKGPGVADEVVLQNVGSSVREVVIDFTVNDSGAVAIDSVLQDGVVSDDFTIDGSNDDGSDSTDMFSSDPNERACQIIDASNIAVPNSVTMIEQSVSQSDCPVGISTIVAVANPGSVAFEYEITSDLDAISVSPTVGVVQPGEINQHDGSYDCSSTESFNTLINASITRYLPNDGGGELTRVDALDLCGPGASAGNTITSVPIEVTVLP